MGIFKKITEIFRKIVIGYVYYTFPLTLIGFFILAKYIKDDPQEFLMQPYYGAFLNTLIYISMAQFIIWTVISLLFSISMFFSRNNRESFLKKLSGIKERDEREIQAVGKALRASYLSTMTILIFILFMSLFWIQYYKKSPDNLEPGEYPRALSYGAGFTFLESEAIFTHWKGYDVFLYYRKFPVSTSGVILILIVWQIVSFRIVSRRALKVPDQKE